MLTAFNMHIPRIFGLDNRAWVKDVGISMALIGHLVHHVCVPVQMGYVDWVHYLAVEL